MNVTDPAATPPAPAPPAPNPLGVPSGTVLNANSPYVRAALAKLNPSGTSTLAPTGAPAASIAAMPSMNDQLAAHPSNRQTAATKNGSVLSFNPTTGDVVQTNRDGSRYRVASGVKDFGGYLGKANFTGSARVLSPGAPGASPYGIKPTTGPTKFVPSPDAAPPPPNTQHAPPVVVPKGADKQTLADAGVFDGTGLFTSWDPSAALKGAGTAKWVAIDPAHATLAQVAQLKAAGMKIMVWQPMATADAADLVKRFGADGYIAQAESQDQLDAAQKYGANVGVPKALVSNNFMDPTKGGKYPPGWVAMPEAYTNDNAPSTVGSMISDARARGATSIIPVTGNYPGSGPNGRPTSMAQYRSDINASNVTGSAAYLAEEMSPQDWADFNHFLYGTGAAAPGRL